GARARAPCRGGRPPHGSSSAQTPAAPPRRAPASAPGARVRMRPPPPRRRRPTRRADLLPGTIRPVERLSAPGLVPGAIFPVTLSPECQLLVGGLLAFAGVLLGYLLCTQGPKRRG